MLGLIEHVCVNARLCWARGLGFRWIPSVAARQGNPRVIIGHLITDEGLKYTFGGCANRDLLEKGRSIDGNRPTRLECTNQQDDISE